MEDFFVLLIGNWGIIIEKTCSTIHTCENQYTSLVHFATFYEDTNSLNASVCVTRALIVVSNNYLSMLMDILNGKITKITKRYN